MLGHNNLYLLGHRVRYPLHSFPLQNIRLQATVFYYDFIEPQNRLSVLRFRSHYTIAAHPKATLLVPLSSGLLRSKRVRYGVISAYQAFLKPGSASRGGTARHMRILYHKFLKSSRISLPRGTNFGSIRFDRQRPAPDQCRSLLVTSCKLRYAAA